MLQIESSDLIVDILPEVGGKIAQIRNKVSGREYSSFRNAPTARFRSKVTGYSTIPAEWMTCLPNVAAGQYPDAPLVVFASS